MYATQEHRTVSRRPSVGAWQAIRRYPYLTVIPAILLAAAGVALGYLREPTYTATSELSVGRVDVSNPAAVGSVVQATQSLAVVYSRMIDASGVKERAARKLGARAAGSTISATPIPGSPIVRVTGTGDSEPHAVRVANTAARSLLRYAAGYDDTSGHARSLARRFRAVSLTLLSARDRVRRLARSVAQHPSRPGERRLNKARAALGEARLRHDTLELDYQVTQQTGRAGPALRMFSVADSATSDRASLMQILGLVGLLAGLALGAALSRARMNRRVAKIVPH
jgi:hypothetical protein